MKMLTPHFIEPRTGKSHLTLSGVWSMGWQDDRVTDPATVETPYQVTVPGTVYHQLYECGQMPDPYFGTNSKKFDWVDDKVWVYKKSFRLDGPCQGQAMLCFDGIVYFARVWLNGTLLGDHEGMFGGPVAEVSSLLNAPGDNELVLEVCAANFRDPAFLSRNGDLSVPHPIVPWNLVREKEALDGDFNVIGPWRDVRIEFLDPVHLSRPYLTTAFLNGDEADLDLEVEVSDPAVDELHALLSDPSNGWTNFTFSFREGNYGIRQSDALTVQIRITDKATGNRIYCQDEDWSPFDWEKSFSDPRYYECHFYRRKIHLSGIRAWWPAALGDPALYECHISLLRQDSLLDEQHFDFGIRTVERVEGAGERFRARWDRFHFVINGQKVFLRGVNWMPIDHFLTLKPEEYRWSLESARNMGVMLIRVWSGGGLPENDDFYRICDELGIMVWQDHPIANCDTSNWDQNVLLEQVALNIYRIRNHPSLAVHCGGNEHNPYSEGNLAAMSVISNLVHDLDPAREWVRTTPDKGSAHIYMDMEPTWYRPITRQLPFVAESGIHSFPSMKAWRQVVSEEELARPLSNIFSDEFNQKNPEVRNHFVEFLPERIPRMLARASAINDIDGITLPDLCEATQLASYEFYQIMIEALRENYPVTTGLMPWVYRRPSVAVGIQLMDGKGNPIAPYYAVRKGYQDLTVSLKLPHLTWKVGEEIPLKVIIHNAKKMKLAHQTVVLTVLGPDLKPLDQRRQVLDLSETLTDADLGTLTVSENFRDQYFFLILTLENETGIRCSKLYWPRALSLMEDESIFARRRSAPAPNLHMEKGPWLKHQIRSAGTTSLNVRVLSTSRSEQRQSVTLQLTNTGSLPAFPVVPDLPDIPCYADDCWFMLMPGESRTIRLTGFRRDGVMADRVSVTGWNFDALTCSLK